MALPKLINLLALASLAILACSFLASPVHAISIDTHNYVRRDHAIMAKKRSTPSGKRCKPRAVNSTTTPVPTPKPSPVKNTSPPPKAPSVAVPAPSPSPQTNPAPSNPSTGSRGKRCLAWSNGDDPALAKWAHRGADKLYTWSAFLPTNTATYGFLGMPMLWGPDRLSEFQKLVVRGYSTIALGFNEPDIPSQSNMDPTYAAQYWQTHMNPLKDQGYTLVSPATVTGPKWLTAFFNACNGKCKVDIIALHWYGTDPAQLTKYLQEFHDQFNMPIWLTEVACQSFTGGSQCNAGQVWALMTALKNFESTSWFETWCWFGAMHDMTNVSILDQLMAADGSPNALGNYFLN